MMREIACASLVSETSARDASLVLSDKSIRNFVTGDSDAAEIARVRAYKARARARTRATHTGAELIRRATIDSEFESV